MSGMPIVYVHCIVFGMDGIPKFCQLSHGLELVLVSDPNWGR